MRVMRGGRHPTKNCGLPRYTSSSISFVLFQSNAFNWPPQDTSNRMDLSLGGRGQGTKPTIPIYPPVSTTIRVQNVP
jgi:hypothetical protein